VAGRRCGVMSEHYDVIIVALRVGEHIKQDPA